MKKECSYILEKARVIDPRGGIDQVLDIGIEKGIFAEPGKVKKPVRINLKGFIAAPGFIDMHVHLRQPGGTDKETIRTGTMAAAAGGFTSIVAMPNTNPAADTPGAIEYLKTHAEVSGYVDVLPAGCITKKYEGVEMSGIGGLKKAGIVALTDDGKCVQNNELMKHVLVYSKTFNLPVLDHCQDAFLSEGGLVHDGFWAAIKGLRGLPSASETIMVARDIILAEAANWKVHIQHVSAGGSVDLIRAAKGKGIQVSAEVTPHHIALTDECIKNFDTNFKMNPPLRSEDDRKKLIEGLRDGTISVIATDHAPHTLTDKLVEFDYAPFGVIGLETAVSVCFTELYHTGYLDLKDLISKFTSGPAEVLGIDAGTIAIGKKADVTILDPNFRYTIDKEKFYSKSRNTPFNGKKVKGRAVATIVSGKFVFSLIDGTSGAISNQR